MKTIEDLFNNEEEFTVTNKTGDTFPFKTRDGIIYNQRVFNGKTMQQVREHFKRLKIFIQIDKVK